MDRQGMRKGESPYFWIRLRGRRKLPGQREVVERMIEVFEQSAGEPLSDRLLQALKAGDLKGGDRRGRKPAAISVVPSKGDEAAINVDLRVDAHEDPIGELTRLRELFKLEFRQ